MSGEDGLKISSRSKCGPGFGPPPLRQLRQPLRLVRPYQRHPFEDVVQVALQQLLLQHLPRQVPPLFVRPRPALIPTPALLSQPLCDKRRELNQVPCRSVHMQPMRPFSVFRSPRFVNPGLLLA